MDYEKKIRDYMNSSDVDTLYKSMLSNLFPELKESKDEKIRNFLIDFIKVCGWTEKKDQGWPLREECIAWLEKQGDEVKYLKDQIESLEAALKIERKHNDFISKIQVGDKVTRNEDGVLVNLSQLNRVAKSNITSMKPLSEILEKQGEQKLSKDYSSLEITDVVRQALQECEDYSNINPTYYAARVGATVESLVKEQGEQKPAVEVEPKFKVGDIVPKFKPGDWITNAVGDICLITGIDLENQYYLCMSNRFGKTDGDIDLTDKSYHLWTIADAKEGDVLTYSDSKNTWICIFKELKNQRCYDYCSYDSVTKFWPRKNWNYDGTFQYRPATKEQREQLFKAMVDAGYEWDAEKKELRKVEQKPAEWSEEDAYYYNIIMYLINGESVGVADKENAIHWLKSLRPQKKQEWNKESSKAINVAIQILKKELSENKIPSLSKDYARAIKILRAVSPQNHWKPSEEQMRDLVAAISCVTDDFSEHPTLSERLNILLEQLKKL